MTGEYIEKRITRLHGFQEVEDAIASEYSKAAKIAFRRRFVYYGVVVSEVELDLMKREIMAEMAEEGFLYDPEESCVSKRFPHLVIIGHKFHRDLPIPETREITFVSSLD